MRRLAQALLLTAGVAATAHASGISDIFITNNSSPNAATASATRFLEFQTAGSAPTSVAADINDVASFDARFAWMTAMRLTAPPIDGSDGFNNMVAFDVTFTVDDPLSRGYLLRLDWLVRGFLTAEWTGAGAGTRVEVGGTRMEVRFIDDLSDLNDFELLDFTANGLADAQQGDTFENSLVSGTLNHQTAPYTGTRTFMVRFTTPGPNLLVRFLNPATGEGNGRFGLDPLTGNFLNASYPGDDGESADQHGLFLNVTAQYLNQGGGPGPSEVPEPSAFGLAGVALCLIGWHRRG